MPSRSFNFGEFMAGNNTESTPLQRPETLSQCLVRDTDDHECHRIRFMNDGFERGNFCAIDHTIQNGTCVSRVRPPAFKVGYAAFKFFDHPFGYLLRLIGDDHCRTDSFAAFEYRL